MGFFEKLFKSPEASAEKPPRREKDKGDDAAALELIEQLKKRGITDKDVRIDSVEGESTGEVRPGGVVNEQRSYMSGSKKE